MRLDRRTAAAVGLIVLSAVGFALEQRPPDWLTLDPLLQPFGQGPPPEAQDAAARTDRERTPVPVHLSRATAAELEALPGIGPRTASNILAWRDSVGVVEDVSRLLEIRGIGPKKLEGLRSWILVGPTDSTLAPAPADSMP